MTVSELHTVPLDMVKQLRDIENLRLCDRLRTELINVSDILQHVQTETLHEHYCHILKQLILNVQQLYQITEILKF